MHALSESVTHYIGTMFSTGQQARLAHGMPLQCAAETLREGRGEERQCVADERMRGLHAAQPTDARATDRMYHLCGHAWAHLAEQGPLGMLCIRARGGPASQAD